METKPKTTRQVLEEALKDQKRTPLYNRKALERLGDEGVLAVTVPPLSYAFVVFSRN